MHKESECRISRGPRIETEEVRTALVADDNQVYYTFEAPGRYDMIGVGRSFSSYKNRLTNGFYMGG